MADHPRQLEAALGNHALFLEVAAEELRVGKNRLPGDFVEGDVLRRQLRRAGDAQAVTDAFGVADGPLQRLHAAEAAADHRGPLADAEAVCQARLAMHPVFHRDHREVRAVDLAGRRIDAGGAAGTVATAEVVEGNDEELAGVDRLARTDAAVPPARLALVDAVVAGGVVVAGEGVADQHRVALRGIQLAVGFDHQVVLGQGLAAGQLERFVEVQRLGGDQTDGVVGEDCGHRPCSRTKEGASLKSVAPSGKRAGARRGSGVRRAASRAG